ncbi:MAG: ParB/RepB/Spo0J family partition protein [Methylocella sp.]
MRQIEPLADVHGPEDYGPVPELRWLPIGKLIVDDAYQREITPAGQRNIRAIADAFSWRKFAPVVVSPVAGGAYAIVDGQHRTTAAATIGVDSVPCLIIQADRKQQAQAFRAINGQVTRMNRLMIYKSALAAGAPEALAVEAVARKAGVTIVTHCIAGKDLKPGHTIACGTIGICLARYGEALTILTLQAVGASEGKRGGSLLSRIIFAVATVLSDHAEWRTDKRLIEVFASVDLCKAYKIATIEAAKHPKLKSSDLLEAAIIDHLTRLLSKRKALA